jgi:hypothetical protein
MTVEIASPIIVAALALVIVELVIMLALLWWRMRGIEGHRDDLFDESNMQGDALREALNEIDRLRRLRPGR